MSTTKAPSKLEKPTPQPQLPASTGVGEPNKPALGTSPNAVSDDVASVNSIQKKMKRAERFGVPVKLSEEDKRNSRAERFGTATTCGPEASKSSEELKKKARAERFGIVQSASENEESKKKARLERFGTVAKTDSLEEEKKKARAMRFSESQSNAKSQQNGGGTIESKKVGEAGV